MDFWTILATALAGIFAFYYFGVKGLNYFKKHNILYLQPIPILGNMWPTIFRQKSMAAVVSDVYNLHPEAKYVGFFDMMTPVVVLRDPELIKTITVKVFDQFPDHRSFIDEVQDPLFGKNLFSLRGERWRDIRTLLSPAFTSSKMKMMFKLMSQCASDFGDYLAKLPEKERTMEMKQCFTRYTNDVIATCAFGISIDSMKDPDNDFYVNGREATTFDFVRSIKFFAMRSLPRLCRLFGIKLIPNSVSVFFKDLIKTTIRTREEKGIVRPDMLQLMMESRGKRGPDKELTIEDMTSQAFIFFFGGFDTTSSAMCFASHEIAVNPDVQTRLQDEIDNVLEETNGELTYEAINKMQYLDAVINETLRMYPIAVFLDRLCLKDYELPPALPGGKPFMIKKGNVAWIPAYGLHRDPKYFDDPNTFNPDRWIKDGKKLMNNGAYIPFGAGPRMCIGNRFALLEIKVLLFHTFAKCNIKPCAKTGIPLELTKKGLSMLAEGGFWLKVEPRNNVHPAAANTKVVHNLADEASHDNVGHVTNGVANGISKA